MKRALILAAFIPLGAFALSQEAKEFMEITTQLEPLQCQKRQLRRQIVMADTEGRAADARKLRADFSKLDRDPKTSKLENRLAELQKSITKEDLPAINRQHVEAFYRCD
jgi:hypothetical protein